MSSSILSFFFKLQTNIKLHHWQTTSYACHKSTDELLEKVSGLVDTFVEVYFGKYNRQMIHKKDAKIDLMNMNEDEFKAYLKECIAFLTQPKLISKDDIDLLNIRDEMVGHLNQALYLCSFM